MKLKAPDLFLKPHEKVVNEKFSGLADRFYHLVSLKFCETCRDNWSLG